LEKKRKSETLFVEILFVSGIYGTKGVGTASTVPGSRHSGVQAIDLNGDFWLFGGLGYSNDFGEFFFHERIENN